MKLFTSQRREASTSIDQGRLAKIREFRRTNNLNPGLSDEAVERLMNNPEALRRAVQWGEEHSKIAVNNQLREGPYVEPLPNRLTRRDQGSTNFEIGAKLYTVGKTYVFQTGDHTFFANIIKKTEDGYIVNIRRSLNDKVGKMELFSEEEIIECEFTLLD